MRDILDYPKDHNFQFPEEDVAEEEIGQEASSEDLELKKKAVEAIDHATPWQELSDDVLGYFSLYGVNEEGYDMAVNETKEAKRILNNETENKAKEAVAYLTEKGHNMTLWWYDQAMQKWSGNPEIQKQIKQALVAAYEGGKDEEARDLRMYNVVSFGVNARTTFSKGFELFKTVLGTYAEMLTEIDSIEEVYKGKMDVEEVKRNLRNKADAQFSANSGLLRLSASAFAGEVEGRYAHVNAKATAFSEVFKSVVERAKQTGEIVDFSDFANTDLEVVSASELTEEIKQAILKIFKENRLGNPAYEKKNEQGQTWLEYLLKDLEDHLNAKQGVEFYLLKKGQDVVGFIRFDELGQNRYHIASFNINKSYKDGKIGAEIFKTALRLKGENNTYVMEADAGNPAMKFYTNTLKFNPTKTQENYQGFGNTYIELERNRVMPARVATT